MWCIELCEFWGAWYHLQEVPSWRLALRERVAWGYRTEVEMFTVVCVCSTQSLAWLRRSTCPQTLSLTPRSLLAISDVGNAGNFNKYYLIN